MFKLIAVALRAKTRSRRILYNSTRSYFDFSKFARSLVNAIDTLECNKYDGIKRVQKAVMKAPTKILFNKSATARILKVLTAKVKMVHEFAFVVWVWISGQRPTFVSKAAYAREFVQFRKTASKALTVLSVSGNRVVVQGSQDRYTVTLSDKVSCTCHDYQAQVETFGIGCCKHGYAALGCLGFNDLRSYLAK